ncbi:MAG: BON domain-containing protein [Pseudomonadota bacterium]
MTKTPSILAALLAAAALQACAPVAVVGSGAVLARSVAQERAPMQALTDTEIELSIATRMGEHSGELYRDVAVAVTEGRVVLTGSVPRREDRVAAERIAWVPAGVTDVTNEITVAEDAGTRRYLNDVGISNALRYRLVRASGVAAVNISVETVDGVVHLTGLARSPQEIDRAVDTARRVEGVERVVSHLLLIDDPRRFAAAPVRPPV